ncbi:MAG: bifunctional diguanylate cyclase/phosphodiesterase [Burkholderiales bacterium]|nr:bifunctional diguanylate cyclase/phosphodiesterase [Burkholderiales bacterium]
MMTPAAAVLLNALPDGGGDLDNFFDALRGVAPQLPRLVADFRPPTGAVCTALRIPLAPSGADARWLGLTMRKLNARQLMAVIHDCTHEVEREQRRLRDRLIDASRTDALTGLPNRGVAIERIQQLADDRRDGPPHTFAVLFLNIDRFHQINDSLGHATGDEVLRLLAARLNAQLRRRLRAGGGSRADALATRIGNDEFVVVLDKLGRPDDVHAITQRLIDALLMPYGVGDQQLHVRVSVGVVLSAQASASGVEVLNDANIAMTESRRVGALGYAVFEPAMRDRAARRGLIEEELRHALARAELYVEYQPVVALDEPGRPLRCTGVEALVRWRHPRRGVVPPIEFIGIAEACGLIGELGRQVLATACADFMNWRREFGPRAPRVLAVNLSRAQLFLPDLVDMVRDTMCSTEIPPASLQLEVTESMAADDEQVRSVLTDLKALGLSLALDDFGTGYSSLSSLHRLPVDLVKIDRSFVSQVDSSDYHRVLVEATVQVARSLRLNTVAEGIETAEQARAVRLLGCEKGQGYLYARPLSSPALVAWLTAAAGDAPDADSDPA